jgi:omega-6 fatty acid desaturase (delta-12 desaturase)
MKLSSIGFTECTRFVTKGLTPRRRIPFYHAEEATWAIAPLLGKRYIQQKSNFFGDLWESFTTCKTVEAGTGAQAGGLVWSKAKA